MAASRAATNAMNDRAADAAVKAVPGLQTTVALGGMGVEVGVGALQIGKKALGAGALGDVAAAQPVRSNSVPVETFMARCGTEAQRATEQFENYLDFHKKYATPAADAVIDLGETHMSWCLIYNLEQSTGDTDDDDAANDDDTPPEMLVPMECVDLCERLWAVDVAVHCSTSADGGEIFVIAGLTYEMLVDEAQFVRPSMRLNDAMGSSRFEADKIHH